MKAYEEHLAHKRVTYTLEIEGKFYIILCVGIPSMRERGPHRVQVLEELHQRGLQNQYGKRLR